MGPKFNVSRFEQKNWIAKTKQLKQAHDDLHVNGICASVLIESIQI